MKDNRRAESLLLPPIDPWVDWLVLSGLQRSQGRFCRGLVVFDDGIAIVVPQPNARSRANGISLCGIIYAFAMWIGLGVMALFEAAKRPEVKAHMQGLALPLVVVSCS